MKWEYKGRKLNAPHTILIRLLLWPLLQLLRCCIFAVIIMGWGWYDAKRIWDDIWIG
jgi:hypothetical protein